MNFSCVSPCMKVKRHAKEYLRTDDDLTEVKVLRFSSLQSLNEQKVKSREKRLARPLSIPHKPPMYPLPEGNTFLINVTTLVDPTKSIVSKHQPLINSFSAFFCPSQTVIDNETILNYGSFRFERSNFLPGHLFCDVNRILYVLFKYGFTKAFNRIQRYIM